MTAAGSASPTTSPGDRGTLGELIDKTARRCRPQAAAMTLPTAMMKLAIPVGPLVGKPMGFPPNLGELIRTSDGVTVWMSGAKAPQRARFLPRTLDAGLRETLDAADRG